MPIKLILIIFYLVLSTVPIYSTTLEGGVSYTVSQARKIVFQNTPTQIPVELFQNYKKYSKIRTLFKEITFFSDGDFSVNDKKNKRCFYYSPNGDLKIIQITIKKTYPQILGRYDSNGNLDSVALDLGNNEQFLFDSQKKLYAHWIGKNGYDENGELFGTRD